MIRSVTLIALALPACAASMTARHNAVRNRAVHDLSCPAESINVTHVSRDLYRAEGCGGTEVYSCAIAVDRTFSCRR